MWERPIPNPKPSKTAAYFTGLVIDIISDPVMPPSSTAPILWTVYPTVCTVGYKYAVGSADSQNFFSATGEPSYAENAKINKQSNRLIFFIASPLIIAASFTRVLLFSHVVYGVVKIAKIF